MTVRVICANTQREIKSGTSSVQFSYSNFVTYGGKASVFSPCVDERFQKGRQVEIKTRTKSAQTKSAPNNLTQMLFRLLILIIITNRFF